MIREHDLIVSMSEGDENAFHILFDYYYPQVRFFVLGIVKNPYIADEIAQGVFIKLWLSRQSIDPDRNFDAWLFTVTRNSLTDYYRRLQVMESMDGLHDVSVQAGFDTIYDTRHIEALVRREVDKMPPQRRQVFILSRLEGLSNEEIAVRLGISKRTVERHLNIALGGLRHNLGDFIVYIIPMIGSSIIANH